MRKLYAVLAGLVMAAPAVAQAPATHPIKLTYTFMSAGAEETAHDHYGTLQGCTRGAQEKFEEFVLKKLGNDQSNVTKGEYTCTDENNVIIGSGRVVEQSTLSRSRQPGAQYDRLIPTSMLNLLK